MLRPRKSTRLFRKARRRWARLMLKLERRLPDWLWLASPWGGSLLLHLTIMIFLAIWAIFGRPQDDPSDLSQQNMRAQLTDDLTTLEEDDQTGDPFTRLEDDQPSLPDDPLDIDPTEISLPKREPIRFSPELVEGFGQRAGQQFNRLRPEELLQDLPRGAVMRQAPFSGRDRARKAALLRREGGTQASEAAVQRGLDWLARHQGPDGRWTLNPRPHCTEGLCPGGTNMESDVAATGLALLAFLGAGHTHQSSSRYQTAVDRGLQWLLDHRKKTGEIFTGGGGNTRMYSHAIATMALCEAYGMTNDRGLKQPSEAAVEFTILAQNQQSGGWRYQPGQRGDTSVFGWQLMSLHSAHLAGIKIPKNVLRGCHHYLDAAATDEIGATYGYQPGHKSSPVMTAEALLCRQYLGWSLDRPAMLQGAGMVYKNLMDSDQRNFYYWYYATPMLHNMGGEPWRRWNQRIRDGLVANQVKGQGCDRGSWDPNNPQPARWGRRAGRHYTTCLALLTLEVYYRYLPLYKDKAQQGPEQYATTDAD